MGDMTGLYTHSAVSEATRAQVTWCSRLRALWSFLSSSHATSSVESAKRFRPASRMAESGTFCKGVYLGWCDSL